MEAKSSNCVSFNSFWLVEIFDLTSGPGLVSDWLFVLVASLAETGWNNDSGIFGASGMCDWSVVALKGFEPDESDCMPDDFTDLSSAFSAIILAALGNFNRKNMKKLFCLCIPYNFAYSSRIWK